MIDAERVERPWTAAEHLALVGVCEAFVREQSCGEWDDKTIKGDARRLAVTLLEAGYRLATEGQQP